MTCFILCLRPLQRLSLLLYVYFLLLPSSFYDITIFLIPFAFKATFLILITVVLSSLIVFILWLLQLLQLVFVSNLQRSKLFTLRVFDHRLGVVIIGLF